MLGFLALGVADLPLLIRYLLVPAVMLCLFCALLAFGWTAVPRSDRAWRAWAAAGLLCLVAVAAYAPRQARALQAAHADGVAAAAIQDDLHRIADDPRFRSAVAGCPLLVPDPRPRVLLAYWLKRSPREIRWPTGAGAASGSSTRPPMPPRASASPPRPRRPGAPRSRPAVATWRATPRGWSKRTASA